MPHSDFPAREALPPASRGAGVATRRARSLGIICVVSFLAALSGAFLMALPASASTPAGGLGINAQVMFWQLPSQYWAVNLDEMRANGVRTVRADAFWDHVEPFAPDASGHHYYWSSTDTIARALAQHGLRWLPIADYSAAWAGSYSVNGQLQTRSPPANYDYFVSYATALVARYGPGGTFWTQNSDLTPQPIGGFEVWNEPDGAWGWMPGPDPAAYARLYEMTRQATHAINPSIQVMIGGITPPSTTFIEGVYAAVGGAGHIDAVGVHPYATESWQVVSGVSAIRSVMDAHGDVNVPIDVTEFGWSTGGPAPVTEALRAQRLNEAVTWVAQSDCGVERILPHTWASLESNTNSTEDWYGITAPDGTQHQSATQLAQTYQTLNQAPSTTHATNSGCGRPLTVSLTSVSPTATAAMATHGARRQSQTHHAKSHRSKARPKRHGRSHRARRGHRRPIKPAAHKPAAGNKGAPSTTRPAPSGAIVQHTAPAATAAATTRRACVQALVRSGSYPVAGAVVTFKVSSGGTSLPPPPPATTGAAGTATACVSVPTGRSALFQVSASDTNFYPVPTAQLTV
jgi:hypothetical protein